MSSFVTKETIPSGRSGHTLLNDIKYKCIYLIGGYNDEGQLNDIYRYDYKLSKWTKLITTSKLSPLPRLECDCCLINSDSGTSIYLFGGVQNIDDQVLIYNDLWHFNTNKITWICMAEETPVAERSGHVMCSISNNNFIIHGGECLGKWFDDTWLYDIKQKKWYSIAVNGTKPIARSSHAITYCEDNNIIALFGGVTRNGSQQEMVHLNDLWILDLKTNDNPREWFWQMINLRGLCPSPRDLPAFMSIGNGKIIVMGGFGLEEMEAVYEDADVDDINMKTIDNEEGNNNNDNDNVEQMDEDEEGDEGEEDEEDEEGIELNSSELEKVTIDDLNMDKMTIALRTNENEPDEDEDEDGIVEVTYLDDCWILDMNSKTSIEVDLAESITNGTTLIPRRGMKITRIVDDLRDIIITFGGFDGSSFHDTNECIDTKKLLLS